MVRSLLLRASIHQPTMTTTKSDQLAEGNRIRSMFNENVPVMEPSFERCNVSGSNRMFSTRPPDSPYRQPFRSGATNSLFPSYGDESEIRGPRVIRRPSEGARPRRGGGGWSSINRWLPKNNAPPL